MVKVFLLHAGTIPSYIKYIRKNFTKVHPLQGGTKNALKILLVALKLIKFTYNLIRTYNTYTKTSKKFFKLFFPFLRGLEGPQGPRGPVTLGPLGPSRIHFSFNPGALGPQGLTYINLKIHTNCDLGALGLLVNPYLVTPQGLLVGPHLHSIKLHDSFSIRLACGGVGARPPLTGSQLHPSTLLATQC